MTKYDRYGPKIDKTVLRLIEIPVKPVISITIPKYPNNRSYTLSRFTHCSSQFTTFSSSDSNCNHYKRRIKHTMLVLDFVNLGLKRTSQFKLFPFVTDISIISALSCQS